MADSAWPQSILRLNANKEIGYLCEISESNLSGLLSLKK